MLKKNDRSLMSKYGQKRRWMPAKKIKKGMSSHRYNETNWTERTSLIYRLELSNRREKENEWT